MTCEACGSVAGYGSAHQVGSFQAELCLPCKRNISAYLLENYRPLMVRFHQVMSEFTALRSGLPSTTGLASSSVFEEALDLDAEMLAICTDWLKAQKPK